MSLSRLASLRPRLQPARSPGVAIPGQRIRRFLRLTNSLVLSTSASERVSGKRSPTDRRVLGQTDSTTAFGVEAQALSNRAQVVLTIAAKRTKSFVFCSTCWCRTIQILPKELKCPAVLESTLSRSLLPITAFSDAQAHTFCVQ